MNNKEDTIDVTVTVPDKQPFEGKATQRQKHRLWTMGYRDEAAIASLGKAQASSIINQLERARRSHFSKQSGRLKLMIGGGLAAAWTALLVAGRMGYDPLDSVPMIIFLMAAPPVALFLLLSGAVAVFLNRS